VFGLIRKIIVWRAQRNIVNTRYRMDRRRYRGLFQAGFISSNHGINLFESGRDPLRLYRRKQRGWTFLMYVVLLVVFGWLAWESAAIIDLF
jgi:hypothetical protein